MTNISIFSKRPKSEEDGIPCQMVSLNIFSFPKQTLLISQKFKFYLKKINKYFLDEKIELINKIEKFNGQKNWLTEWANRERRKSAKERENEKELYDAIWNTNWETAKRFMNNGTTFDCVDTIGTGPIYWLLYRAYGHISDAKNIWNKIENETKNEEVEKAWSILMVMENYGHATWVISWSNLTHLVAKSKLAIINTILMKQSGYLNEENVTKIIDELGERTGEQLKSEFQLIEKKQLFEKNAVFLAKLVKSAIENNVFDGSEWNDLNNPISCLILLSKQNEWKPEFTKTILEKIMLVNESQLFEMHSGRLAKFTKFDDNYISDLTNWIANLKNPIYHLLVLTKETDWTDKLTNQVLAKLTNKNQISEDMKFIAANDKIKNIAASVIKLLPNLDHPIYVLLILSKAANWTEDMTKRVLDEFGQNFRNILENDLKYVKNNGLLADVESELTKQIQIAKSYNMFKNKYVDTEPLSWTYQIGSSTRRIAAFFKDHFLRKKENFVDFVANIQSRDVKVWTPFILGCQNFGTK